MLRTVRILLLLISCGLSMRPCSLFAETVAIGLVIPLTGSQATYGLDARRVVQLLESGDFLSVKHHKYRFILEDGQCGIGNSAVTAARKLIHVDKVKFVITGCSGETFQVAPIAEKFKVITIAYASSHRDIRDLGDYVFRTYVDFTKGVHLIADLIKKEQAEKIALITEESSFTLGIKEDLGKLLAGRIGFTADFNVDESDFNTLLLRAKAAKPAAYYLNTASPKTYQTIYSQLRQLGITEQVYSYHAPSDHDVLRNLSHLQDGVKFLAVPEVDKGSPEFESFYADYLQRFPEGANIECLLRTSYDAIISIINAVEAVGPDTGAVKDFFYTQEMPGAVGKVAFDRFGDIKELNFVLKEIIDGKPQRISPLN